MLLRNKVKFLTYSIFSIICFIFNNSVYASSNPLRDAFNRLFSYYSGDSSVYQARAKGSSTTLSIPDVISRESNITTIRENREMTMEMLNIERERVEGLLDGSNPNRPIINKQEWEKLKSEKAAIQKIEELLK